MLPDDLRQHDVTVTLPADVAVSLFGFLYGCPLPAAHAPARQPQAVPLPHAGPAHPRPTTPWPTATRATATAASIPASPPPATPSASTTSASPSAFSRTPTPTTSSDHPTPRRRHAYRRRRATSVPMLTADPFRRPTHEGGAITARPSDADARADRFDQFARDERQRIGDEADALARLNPESPHAPRRQADHDRRADQARQLAHAASHLADLFRAGFVPSVLYGLRTRAHLRAAVLSERPTPDVLHTLRTALRFTRGLGMSRVHAFHKVRQALALAGALDGAGETPDPFDAWRRAVRGAFCRRLPPATGETPLSAESFRTLDWRRAFASRPRPRRRRRGRRRLDHRV